MIVYSTSQYSEEWWSLRCGTPTASQAHRIIKKDLSVSKQAGRYADELRAEKVFGPTPYGYSNDAMQTGHEREGEARGLFSFSKNVKVLTPGFILHSSRLFGCSPDGLFLENGNLVGLEIKCPQRHTHEKNMKTGPNIKKYNRQLLMSSVVCGGIDWVIMSYFPGMPIVLERFSAPLKLKYAAKRQFFSFSRRINEVNCHEKRNKI